MIQKRGSQAFRPFIDRFGKLAFPKGIYHVVKSAEFCSGNVDIIQSAASAANSAKSIAKVFRRRGKLIEFVKGKNRQSLFQVFCGICSVIHSRRSISTGCSYIFKSCRNISDACHFVDNSALRSLSFVSRQDIHEIPKSFSRAHEDGKKCINSLISRKDCSD